MSTTSRRNGMNMPPSSVLAIVGGGPAAVSVCSQVVMNLKAKKCRQPLEIYVFERQKRIGPGLPYGQESNCFLINFPADRMEPIDGQTGQFAAFCQDHPDCTTGSEFPPRRVFGEYLESVGLEAQKSASQLGVKVHYVTGTEVKAIRKGPVDDYIVDISPGSSIRADFICLCSGHTAPKPFVKPAGPRDAYLNPWAPGSFDFVSKFAPNATVAVLGTRLTAIDVVRQLIATGHKGKIIMASRSGLLPTVLPLNLQPHVFKYLTTEAVAKLTNNGSQKLKLADLKALLKKEILDAEDSSFSPAKFFATSSKQISAEKWLEREVGEAESYKRRKWQEVVRSIQPRITELWPMLSEADQKEYLDHDHSLVLTYLISFPLESAKSMQNFLASGQVKILGGLGKVEPAGSSGRFRLHFDDKSEVLADQIFDARGIERPEPLETQLINTGLVSPHPFGGLRVDLASLRTMNGQNGLNGRIAALGAATRGNFLLSANMFTVAQQASRVAAWIVEDLCSYEIKRG